MFKTNSLTSYFLLSLIPLCWAGDLVLARGGVAYAPPFSLVFWRWLLSLIIILPFSWRTTKNDLQEIKISWGKLPFVYLSCVSMFLTFLYIVVRANLGFSSALIQTTIPALFALMSLFLYSKRITRYQSTGIALCLLGICYVSYQGGWSAATAKKSAFIYGDMLVLITTAIYGFYSSVLGKSSRIHPISFLTVVCFIGTVTMLPFFIWEISSIAPVVVKKASVLQLVPDITPGLLYLAAIPAIISYLCWHKGVTLIGEYTPGVFITLAPVFAAMLAVPFLREELLLYHGVGMGLVLAGMIVFNFIDGSIIKEQVVEKNDVATSGVNHHAPNTVVINNRSQLGSLNEKK